MEIRTNTLKKALYQGKKQYGIWHGIPHPYVAEICASSGFDWVCIDGEHAPFDLQRFMSSLQGIQSHNVPALVRVPKLNPSFIKQLLDIGAQNIVIPMLESADAAELAVKALLYPPHGIRGVGTGFARAAQWGRVKNYLHVANEQMCCIGQVESLKGVEALEEILVVEGLDVVLFGPADLAASMGYLGEPGHKEVVALMKESIQKVVKANKIAGFMTVSHDLIHQYRDAGALMLGVAGDSILLAEATHKKAELYKNE